jgi:O-antigen/teichoic acid export membrane protein
MAIVEPAEAQATEAQSVTSARRKRTSFAGDVLKLVSGTSIAQALGILATPLLTRLYAPEAFGVLALFTSITSIVGVVACLRYELAIMLPERDEEAANLLAVSLLAVAGITALSVPIVTLGRPLLLQALNAPQLGPYLWLVPVTVFFGGVFQALNYWNSRTKQFGRLSVVRVVSSASTHAAKLGAGIAGYATGGALIGGTVLGLALSTLELGRRIWCDDNRLFRASVQARKMLQCIVCHQRFPMIDVWSALLNTFSWQLPALLLSRYFSAAVVGQYSLGLRVLQLPMSLIGGAIGQVFYQRAADAKAQGTLDRFVSSRFRQLVAIGLFPMLVIAVSGRQVFTVAFGEEWAQAGVYAQILSIWTFFWFVSSPISTLIPILGKQGFALAWNMVSIITRFISLWIGAATGSPETALLLFAVSGAVLYCYAALKLFSLCGGAWIEMASLLGRAILGFAPVAAALVLLNASPCPDWVSAAAAGLVLLLYYGREARRDSRVRSAVRRIKSASIR